MVDYLLLVAAFFCLLMTASQRALITRFCLSFFGLFLSLSIIFQDAGLAGILLLFNLSIFTATLLAVYENISKQQEDTVGLSRRSGIVVMLLFLFGFFIHVFVFEEFLYPFTFLLGVYSLFQRNFIKRFTAIKIIESTIYGALLLFDIIDLSGIILFNLWMAISSIALLRSVWNRGTRSNITL